MKGRKLKCIMYVLPLILVCTFCGMFYTLPNKNYSIHVTKELYALKNNWNLIQNTELIEKIVKLDGIVRNQEQFGPLTNDDVVIAVQVHNRSKELGFLISSLKKVENVAKVLVIFSHDLYDEHLNNVVNSIDFCKYMQIFYPYSIQLHPNAFPGPECNEQNHSECTEKDKKERGLMQIKNHWWWKANTIFMGLPETKNHNGLVLFIEEDNYIVPDILYMFEKIQQYCVNCVISSGLDLGNLLYPTSIDKAFITRHFKTTSMAIKRQIWKEIARCYGFFCTFDDYNWDWTMNSLQDKCTNYAHKGISMTQARVFHIGECGTHQKHEECDPSGKVKSIEASIRQLLEEKRLFPTSLQIDYDRSEITIAKWRGWSNKKDQELCIRNTIITD